MEVAALRLWGLVSSAAAISAALTIAVLGGCGETSASAPGPTPAVEAPAATTTPPGAAAGLATAPTPSTSEPVAQTADASSPPPPAPAASNDSPSFLVRFAAPHPMARAQRVAAQGDVPYARVLAVQAIRARPEMRGLCYGGFTVGGAEVILTACIEVADVPAFHRRWQTRLNRMSGVTYAEPNLTAQPAVGR